MIKPPTLLSLAGYDPSGGAGLTLDLAVFESLGFHGAGVMTALTIQNTRRVVRVETLSARTVADQYRALRGDLPWKGVKVGMIGSRENLELLGRILAANAGVPRVVDPVLRSSSGAWLIERKALPRFLPVLKGRVELLTPNVEEAALLMGRPVRSLGDMRSAARAISEACGAACLVKGGHLPGPVMDVLFNGRRERVYRHARIRADVHGTGCFLSAAVLACLARGASLERACGLAIRMTIRAIRTAGTPGRGRRIICVRG